MTAGGEETEYSRRERLLVLKVMGGRKAEMRWGPLVLKYRERRDANGPAR